MGGVDFTGIYMLCNFKSTSIYYMIAGNAMILLQSLLKICKIQYQNNALCWVVFLWWAGGGWG